MEDNGQNPAYPTPDVTNANGDIVHYATYGLTKREHMAALAMPTFARVWGECESRHAEKTAKETVAFVDALLAALEPAPAGYGRGE